MESHWSNVSSSVHAVLPLSTGLESISGVMSAWITPSEHHILTPKMVDTHHTCTYGSEHVKINKNSNKSCYRTVGSSERGKLYNN